MINNMSNQSIKKLKDLIEKKINIFQKTKSIREEKLHMIQWKINNNSKNKKILTLKTMNKINWKTKIKLKWR